MFVLLSLNILASLSAILFFTGYELTSKLKELLERLFSNELVINFLWFTFI